MYNIIRSIQYTTHRNSAVIIAVLAMVVSPLVAVTLFMGKAITRMDGAEYYLSTLGELFFLWIFAVMILSAIPVASDAGDRTLNYELLAGHGRSCVFFARTISGLFWGAIVCGLLYFLPLVYFGLLGGWYQGVSARDVALRALLTFLPLLRTSAFIIMLSSLLRSTGKGIGFGFLILEFVTIIIETVKETLGLNEHALNWTVGMYNVVELNTLTNCRDYVIDGEKVTVYETALSRSLVIGTVAASLFFGTLYLIIAYVDFAKRDRD